MLWSCWRRRIFSRLVHRDQRESVPNIRPADRSASHLRAERVEDGMKWTQSENRLQPYHLLAQTGLMQGAAGIGLFLVHVAQISRHQKALIQFPDETAVGKQPNRHASIKRR